MLPTRLTSSFDLIKETHSQVFERFANAYLVDDYPEIDPLGGKKDGGIDGRMYYDNGELYLVVQSCVSPFERAKTKIDDTIEKLKKIGFPKILIFCSPAAIGLKLDQTKREIRQKYKVILEICDGPWFVQRVFTSENRTRLAEAFSEEVLAPIVSSVKPNAVYSGFLNEESQRIAISYFEAQNLEESTGQNLTKSLFDAFIAFALRDSDPPQKIYSMDEIIELIARFLPTEHFSRAKEIIPGRVENLVNKGLMKIHRPQNKYTLSFPFRDDFKKKLKVLEDSEIQFLAEITRSLNETAAELGIDYSFEDLNLPCLIQQNILWFMKVEGDRFRDPYTEVIHVLNAEALVVKFFSEKHPQLLNTKATKEKIYDLAPQTVFKVINSKNLEIQAYLRRKADLFIIGSMMQISPDVQECCRNLLGNDHFFLDTTVLIRCAAEYFMPQEKQHFLKAFRNAQKIGIRLKTFHPCIQEVVSHIKGPIYLEWINNWRHLKPEEIEEQLFLRPTLFKVFYFVQKLFGNSFEKSVNAIIGQGNHFENVVEFFEKELNISCEDHSTNLSQAENLEWQIVFGKWLGAKRKKEGMKQEKFELLVKNDVNSYLTIIDLRRKIERQGTNYGEKVWFLTTDQVYWRIPRLIEKGTENLYQVSMSLDYLLNYVSTVSKAKNHQTFEMVSPFGDRKSVV